MTTSLAATPPAAENENLFAVLRSGFPADLETTAVETDGGLRYSWGDLERASAMIANLFGSLGLPAGSRIAVQVEKSVEAVALYLATLRAGHVFLPLNTAYQSAELAYFLTDAQPAVLVCRSASFSWLSQLAHSAGAKNVYTLDDDRSGTLLERAAQMGDRHDPVPCRGGELAAILYTSGTTGRSKGAMLSHENLVSNLRVLHDYWGWREHAGKGESGGDVLIHALPIFHVHGLFVALHGALLSGSKMLWFGKFDPKAVLGCLPRATVFMGVPTLYVRLLAEAGLNPGIVRQMRLFVSGSAPLLLDTFDAWKERTGHTILERYGMSETAMLTSNPYRADLRYGGESERRGGTVGFPLPGVELRVVDDNGTPAGEAQVGAIQVSGPNVFRGYWRMPEKTKQEFTADGYFKTGDVGMVDERGYVSIVGRSKDLIISGGYNVYPAEIEGCLNDLPGVAESAVVGVPHPDFGEVGVALVVPRAGADLDAQSLMAELKSRLANFKIPKHCEVMPELPRNTMGKVQKNLLRDQFRQLFGPDA